MTIKEFNNQIITKISPNLNSTFYLHIHFQRDKLDGSSLKAKPNADCVFHAFNSTNKLLTYRKASLTTAIRIPTKPPTTAPLSRMNCKSFPTLPPIPIDNCSS
ncbi:hypothetical protein HNP99_002862 [Flavobacterium sp. 28A]|nr:hypothetical protein [Flavobacterium sp. 28A]